MRPAPAVLSALGLVALLGMHSACASPDSSARTEGEGPGGTPSPSTGTDEAGRAGPPNSLGDGFLVWESNRTGNWRLWTRELAPSPARQLTPDEGARQHCCAHISPDGTRVAYLSFPDAMAGYAAGGSEGVLHLIGPDGSGDRVLAESARSSWESRAAVWRNDHELIYIRGDGSTVVHDLDDDTVEVLVPRAAQEIGKTWLIDARLGHAVSGAADFSVYNPTNGSIAEGRTYGGCQPYFSHDGRWGFWAAGTGGPIDRIELATGKVSTILAKSDPRIPDGLGYAYFPMFSPDGRLFAFAASDYQHNHFLADYEIFVAPSDPETLELLGDAVRMTSDPATDRFPDVFLEPLPLGRFQGEAPYTVRFRIEGGMTATAWDFGDGASFVGAQVEHAFTRPGSYRVIARPPDPAQTALHGQVVVKPAAPPAPVTVRLRDEGRSVEVRFDEKIRADRPKLRFASGARIAGWRIGGGEPAEADPAAQRALVIELEERIDGFDRLHLEGIADRAQVPNWIEPLSLEIEPPLWPSDRRALAFLFETGEAPNLVWDPQLEAERACSVTAAGRAILDHDFAMALEGGRFVASAADAASILEACRKSHEFSLEAVIRPSAATPPGLRKIVSFSGGTPQSRNFILAQQGERLVFSPRAGNPAPDGTPEVEIGRLRAGKATHVVIAYRVGRLVAYLDGEAVVETDAVQGGFFHWKPRPLLFGDGPRGGNSWTGTLEGVAVYSRFLGAEEARENYARYRRKIAARPAVPRLIVEATLIDSSEIPSLDEITPYREALAVFEYRVDRVIDGPAPPEPLRVARWTILDGKQVGRGLQAGESARLTLEPFADNRQLASSYLADTLEPASGPLYYAVSQ